MKNGKVKYDIVISRVSFDHFIEKSFNFFEKKVNPFNTDKRYAEKSVARKIVI